MKNVISPIKGTRDFYPEIMAVRTWLYSKIRKISESFGYQEYEGPFLETINLYAVKSGEELVKEQSFVFPDRGGDLITLRPELTPTLARMVASRQNQLVMPLRWWSFGPFWRYERPQKGRSREFFQWNIDLIGVNTPEADAELIAIIAAFFKEVGLPPEKVKILVNDRSLMEQQVEAIGIPAERKGQVFRLIDRKDKLPLPEWEAFAGENGLEPRQIDGLEKLLDNRDLWRESANLARIYQVLEYYQAASYFEFDPNIIRGLDYYTSTVFEAKEISGSLRRSILGGGRYDNLLSAVGGEPLPAVGFAMGDMVITLVLESAGCIPAGVADLPAKVLVTSFNENTYAQSLEITQVLRNAGIQAMSVPDFTGLNKQLKYADRVGIPLVILLGPDEINNQIVTIKDLGTKSQVQVPSSQLVEEVRRILDAARPS